MRRVVVTSPVHGLAGVLAGVLAAVVAACGSTSTGASGETPPPCAGAPFEAKPLAIRCGQLVDAEGREVVLTGLNARVAGVFDETLDGGRTPLEPIPAFDGGDAQRMRALGFNALRLPIQWSGVEPTETGGFDEAYLDRVMGAIDVARGAGLYVLVDIHQDAYSKEIGEDGAPYWAIVPPPPQKLGGPLHDLDQRRLSKPVLDAFETFFGPSADGARLRDRFAKMAAHVAARIVASDAVVGFELLNEPLTTSDRLLAFHREVTTAVRAAAPALLVFFEPPVTRNFLDRADVANGAFAAGTVYAPHVYTGVFNGPDAEANVTRDLVERSYVNAREEADSWQAPLVTTEIGFPPSAPNFASYVGWHAELSEQTRASTFFWLWKEATQGAWGFYDFDASAAGGGVPRERPAVVDALARVRVEACAGRVLELSHPSGDPGRLVLRFFGTDATRESLVSLGARFRLVAARCDDAEAPTTPGEPMRVTCGGPGEHVLAIDAERSP